MDTRQTALCVAKFNLGTVKIKPMLVAGCVFWGQWITPKAHMTLCRVVARAWHLRFAGVALRLCVCKLWQLADHSGSLARVYVIFIDSSLSQCSKLAVARLPETTKTSFGQLDFRKNKGQVAQKEFAGQPRKKLKYLHYCVPNRIKNKL